MKRLSSVFFHVFSASTLIIALAGCLGNSDEGRYSAEYTGPDLPVWTAPDAVPSRPGRQIYKISPEKAKNNSEKVSADLNKIPEWRNSPAVYYVVDPLSDIRRTPDLYPEDGRFSAPLEIVAARGEFEPGSFVVYARKNVDKFTLQLTELKNEKNGDVIPASALDAKLVKVWYQCGAGWCGEFSDPLGRILVPELLVNDENLIFCDPATQDNYARYSNKDGSTTYEWISADFQVTGYKFSNMVRIAMLKDADTLQPVVLNKDEFKQFMITAHVPQNAKGGIYTGKIVLKAEGKNIGVIPVQLGVLNFELPEAATHYDLNKPFRLSPEIVGRPQDIPRILQNLIEHNALYIPGAPKVDPGDEEKFAREIDILKKAGAKLQPLFYSGPHVSSLFPNGELTPVQAEKLAKVRKELDITAALSKKYLGHSDIYCYGVDEGDYWTIRNERRTWNAAHAAGLKTMVAARDHKRNLFSLDYLHLPRMPRKERAEVIRLFHTSHPDGLCGWYGDPHCGPENPDYMRRLHGLNAYYADYDAVGNYVWYRNDWNDMAVAYESNYRGIILVYAISDRVLDTLAWEGFREGMDDVRYATLVRKLSEKALASKDADVQDIARLALGYLAYWDTRENPDTFRMECTRYIIRLEKALSKEAK